jgi:acyl carrier protein
VSAEEKVRQTLSRLGRLPVDVESLSDDCDLFDAGLSSQAAVEVVFALEDLLAVEIPDEHLQRDSLRTIATLSATLRAAGADG